MSIGSPGVTGPKHADLSGLVSLDVERIRAIDSQVPAALQTATFATG